MKKALAALLALILLVALIPNVATAEESTYAYELVIRGGSIPGNTVTVDGQDCLKVDVWINGIDDDHLLASTSFSIGYNTDQLTYVSAEQGSLYAVDKDGKNQGTQSLMFNNKDGELRFALASSYGCRIQSNKPLVTLYFTVSDSLTSADTIAFELGDKATAESVVMTQQIENQTKTTKCNLTADFKPYSMSVPKFKSYTLELEGKIGVNFYMELPEINGVDYAESYMTFTITGQDGCTERDDFDANDYKVSKGVKRYRFSCMINAAQMADTITATFHYGKEQTVTKEYSAKKYIEKFNETMSSYNATAQAMVKALADYGHYVQLFLKEQKGWTFGKEHAEMDICYTTEYDIEAVKTAVADYGVVRENNSNGDIPKKASYTLLVESETKVRASFTPDSGYNGTFSVTLDGKEYTAVKNGDKYVVDTPGIPSYDLDKAYMIVATTDHGTSSIRISALSYVKSVLNSSTNTTAQNAMASIYYYATAAKAYKAAFSN